MINAQHERFMMDTFVPRALDFHCMTVRNDVPGDCNRLVLKISNTHEIRNRFFHLISLAIHLQERNINYLARRFDLLI